MAKDLKLVIRLEQPMKTLTHEVFISPTHKGQTATFWLQFMAILISAIASSSRLG
jgi:hypothetical protein